RRREPDRVGAAAGRAPAGGVPVVPCGDAASSGGTGELLVGTGRPGRRDGFRGRHRAGLVRARAAGRHVVDDDGGAGVVLDVAVLAAGRHVVAADVDDAGAGVVVAGHGADLGVAGGLDGCEPPEPL